MASADTGERQPAWRKSRRSIGNGECVEVRSAQDNIIVRDSADPTGPIIPYSTRAWIAFIADARTGKFDESSLIRDISACGIAPWPRYTLVR